MILTARSLIIIGLIFHCLYVFSIFDIYFRSPLIHGMAPHSPNSDPLSERVVLFVADGLRADKVFESIGKNPVTGEGITRAPFLHSKAKEGQWGVSHAHVPTESRPGHVALIAGFYEDVSAVTHGWKTNPVEFDSFFNQSSHCWAWGSPDILPMFSLSIPHMYAESYPPEFEDFGREGSHMDTWVFEKLQDTFQKAESDKELYDRLHESKVVFFLHLLGIDSNGHAYRPYSKEYLNNIEIVDSGIEQTVHLIDNFFGDSKTTYIFTADHGMSNKGSHGDSDPSNTLTPLITWGSGIATGKPNEALIARNTPNFEESHKLWPIAKDSTKSRMDVEQGDVALLMSGLLGTAFPMNAVSVIPTEYLNCTMYEQADLLYTNAKQIYEQLNRKSLLKESTAIFFKPYVNTPICEELLNEIPQKMKVGDYSQVIDNSKEIIELSLQGLHYLQTYDWAFLMTTITCGFLGWMGVVTLYIYSNYGDNNLLESKLSSSKSVDFPWIIFILAYSCLSIKLYLERAPIIYYAYCFFPSFFWCQILSQRTILKNLLIKCMKYPIYSLGFIIVTVSILEILVCSFFERQILSFCLLCIGLFTLYQTKSIRYIIIYLIIAIFPLLPAEYGDDLKFVYIGGSLLFPIAVLPFYLSNSKQYPSLSVYNRIVAILQILIVPLSLFQVYAHTNSIFFFREVTWILSGMSFFLPLFTDSFYLYRIISIFVGIGIPYVLLSIHYEVLYYICLGILLFTWFTAETKTSSYKLSNLNIRLSLIYLVLYFVAFFGTGNIASISSFEISSTYRFVRIFDPFLMAALLLFKLMIPFVLVCCCYILINRATNQPESGSFFTVINMYDIIAISFFFLVRDSGSWKDIGVSIGHYIVACAFIVIQLGLFCTALIFLNKTAPKLSTSNNTKLHTN